MRVTARSTPAWSVTGVGARAGPRLPPTVATAGVRAATRWGAGTAPSRWRARPDAGAARRPRERERGLAGDVDGERLQSGHRRRLAAGLRHAGRRRAGRWTCGSRRTGPYRLGLLLGGLLAALLLVGLAVAGRPGSRGRSPVRRRPPAATAGLPVSCVLALALVGGPAGARRRGPAAVGAGLAPGRPERSAAWLPAALAVVGGAGRGAPRWRATRGATAGPTRGDRWPAPAAALVALGAAGVAWVSGSQPVTRPFLRRKRRSTSR